VRHQLGRRVERRGNVGRYRESASSSLRVPVRAGHAMWRREVLERRCFAACETDAECGIADRCSVESGRRLCMPDPNPVVRCDHSADCRSGQTCVDGTCHAPCDVDTDCADPQDRCLFNLCFADRRPIAECVLNLECTTGLVCLDGRCVELDGG
jgi:hypothetical protein